MSVAAAQADAFFREVVTEGRVFAVRDAGGIPAPADPSGARSMPFWSKASRARAVIERVDAYRGMEVVELGLDEWTSRWLPGLARDGLLVGVNWSGDRATGYDLSPADVLARLDASRAAPLN